MQLNAISTNYKPLEIQNNDSVLQEQEDSIPSGKELYKIELA